MNGLSKETLDLCFENEAPHITDASELKILQETIASLQVIDGVIPDSEVARLFQEAQKERGTYEKDPDDESKPLKIGHEFRTFVGKYIYVLAASDSTKIAA